MTAEDFIKTSLPNSTQSLSRDAVEILVRLAFEAGCKQGRKHHAAEMAEEERDRLHGPMFT